MSSRVFQSVIVQMKEATDRMIGVIDADSTVISCSDTSRIGENGPRPLSSSTAPRIPLSSSTKRPSSRSFPGAPTLTTPCLPRATTRSPEVCASWPTSRSTARRPTMRKSTTREPSSRISSPTTFCRAISISARRSCTSSPTRRAPSSSSGR